jgi:transposase
MMGHKAGIQEQLFSYHVSLDARVREDHPLRKIQQIVDFDFIYAEVGHTYGENGNVSVPPPVILKMMLLLFLYNVRSERELMDTIPERLDWLWFLGYTLDDEIPNHSVLSKARARWGVDAFRSFFERIVWQCAEAGLVDGSKLFVDASLIDANASNNSVVDRHSLQRYLNKRYVELEERLEEKDTPANGRHVSTTDPDAAITRQGGSKAKVRYKTHRGVDPQHEVITATTVTAGSVDDGKMLDEVVLQHARNTQSSVDTVVADSKYGTTENYLNCHDRGIEAHMPCLEKTQAGTGRREGIFSRDEFIYAADADVYVCPAGQELRKRHYQEHRNGYEYQASAKVCAACALRDQCTRAKGGRTIKRHVRQEDLDRMRVKAQSRQAKRDIKIRQDLSERSFARSTRYGFKRARWRRLWRMQIQDYLIAAIQNIMTLLTHRGWKKALGKAKGIASRATHNALLCIMYTCIGFFLRDRSSAVSRSNAKHTHHSAPYSTQIG